MSAAVALPPMTRFLRKVDRTGDCHEWLGAKQAGGYGRFKAAERVVLCHRWIYEQTVGPIPLGMTIDHLCRNTSCVNVAHMEVVTREVNARRGNPNTGVTHCKRGHELTDDNVYVAPKRPSNRDCRACRRINHEARMARRQQVAA